MGDRIGDFLTDISIHALREEGDGIVYTINVLPSQFLSTPSARRATILVTFLGGNCIISIHALREEGDGFQGRWKHHYGNFYPRPPRGGRQQKQRQNLYFLINYTTFCTNLEEP